MLDATVLIRRRSTSDAEACAAIASLLHHTDGYPEFLPEGDFAAFVTPSNMLDGWIAIDGRTVVGHVLLRTSSAPLASGLAATALGVDASTLAFVSRLMVAPAARRRGIARRLLDTATEGGRALGRVPVLDVLVKDLAAIALYERAGWHRLGQTTFTTRDGRTFDEIVFAAP